MFINTYIPINGPVVWEKALENYWTSTVLPDLIKGYELKDIFNADEFGFF